MKNFITISNVFSNLEEKDLTTVGSIFEYLNQKYVNKHSSSLKEIEYELEKIKFLEIFNKTNRTNFNKVLVSINNGILNISVK